MSGQNIVGGSIGAGSIGGGVVGGSINSGIRLTATSTSVSSAQDPTSGYSMNTVITPLFTVVDVVPPGDGALPFFNVTVVNPPISVSGRALTYTEVEETASPRETVDATMRDFSLHAVISPGPNDSTPSITITLTVF